MDIYTQALNVFADVLNGFAYFLRKLAEVLGLFTVDY